MSFVVAPIVWMIGGGVGILIAGEIGLSTYPALVFGVIGVAVTDFACFTFLGAPRSIGRKIKNGPRWVHKDKKVGLYDIGGGEWKAVHYPSMMEATGETPSEADAIVTEKMRKHGWDDDLQLDDEYDD